jgi:hypothetical protein
VTIPSSSGCTLGDGQSTSTKDGSFLSQTSLTGFSVYCPAAGTTVPVTVIYDKKYDTSKAVIRYYNPTTHTFSTVSGTTFDTQIIGGVAKSTATYILTDGGAYDEDGAANGVIKDPVGLAIAVGAPNTGYGIAQSSTSQAEVIELMALSLGLLGIAAIMRKFQLK